MTNTTTANEKRIEKFATHMGKAIARLARFDLEAAKRMSDLACQVSADMRAGKL